jgi:hypothetical protein
MPPVATTTGNEIEKGRILIVDDEPDITNSYSSLFRGHWVI